MIILAEPFYYFIFLLFSYRITKLNRRKDLHLNKNRSAYVRLFVVKLSYIFSHRIFVKRSHLFTDTTDPLLWNQFLFHVKIDENFYISKNWFLASKNEKTAYPKQFKHFLLRSFKNTTIKVLKIISVFKINHWFVLLCVR